MAVFCDIGIEMVGHNQGRTLDLCTELTKDDGTILLCGLLTLDGAQIEAKHLIRNLKFVCSSAPTLQDFATAVEMIHRGIFDPAPLFLIALISRTLRRRTKPRANTKMGSSRCS